ncbi:MAG: HAMP domain-containing sensor histidine kinase, partial [Chloroflexota bacterium]|nr:HAMP domain-containing sensor histidine kinase [Chloroflexota bacterium]
PAGGTVEISLRATDNGSEIKVADTGVGIDARELPYVFDRFYRGTQAIEPRATGSGLGLSIVRSIVEMHDGRVAITSTPGAGTQVSVILPSDVSVSSSAAARA